MDIEQAREESGFGANLINRKRSLKIDLKESGDYGVISLILALNFEGLQYEEDYISQICSIGGFEYNAIVRRVLDEREGTHWGRDDVGSLFPID